jgi:signal transduction histidine kinase
MLRNVSINGKGALLLTVPTMAIAALLVPLILIGYSLADALEEAERSQQLSTRLESIQSTLVTIQGENLQLALLGASDLTGEIPERASAAESDLEAMTGAIDDADALAEKQRTFASLAQSLLDRLLETQRQVLQGNLVEGRRAAASDDRELGEVVQLAEEIRREVRSRVITRFAETDRLSAEGMKVLIGGSIAAIAIVVTFGWLLLRSMLWRLHTIQENVLRMERGDELVAPVPAEDEIGRIDTATHKMVRSLRAQQSENEMFIYSVSHDLRSPLVNLQGFGSELHRTAAALSKLIGETPDVPAEVKERANSLIEGDMGEALRFIDLAVQRQARIIDSLLSLSRAGRVDYHWQNVALDEQVRELVAELSKRLPDGSTMTVREPLPTVYGDADALVRVFENLLNNAIKYRHQERDAQITVGVAEASPAGSYTIFVQDNGIGMTEQQCERATLPFSRYAGGEGEGIGLSLVKRVVDRHHGSLKITSVAGEGTTVHVTLMQARPVGSDE